MPRLVLALLTYTLVLTSVSCTQPGPELSSEELSAIGQLIYRNECAGKESCLTSWNAGEEFASLGIGHFIWYPAGATKQFDESFPKLLHYMHAEGAPIPVWLAENFDAPCPWASRKAFLAARNTQKMNELRQFLAKSKQKQAEFMSKRLNNALPRMLASIPESQRSYVRQQFDRVAHAPMGMYALIDYVNFKGEGIKPSERYREQGWGLLQVLEAMQGEEKGSVAIQAFARTARQILKRRVRNSPPERNEARWLTGWEHRLQTYVTASGIAEGNAG